jgi:Double-GTPase 2
MSERAVDGPDDPTVLLDLPHGKGLQPAATAVITKRALTSVVLFAGTADCGKTTLLATLHLLFQDGTFAGYNFAGSDTLVGFEDRVSLTRTASGRSTPTTPRTRVSEYLHLRVRREDCSAPIRDVILCDLWGEDFREAKDNVDACRNLTIIRRAHRFVLLVDGGRLAKTETKQSAKNDPLMLLRNCLETEMLHKKSMVDVLITKWDLVEASSERDEVIAFVNHVEGEVRNRLSGRVGRLRFARVAAQAVDDSLPLGYGLSELFPDWAEAIWGDDVPEQDTMMDDVSSEFDRFFRRYLAAKG